MNELPLRKNGLITSAGICSLQFHQATLDYVGMLYRQVLQLPGQARDPREALRYVYHQLSEEHKIAFLLAGGAAQLLHNQRQAERRSQERRGRKASYDPDTGDPDTGDPDTGELPTLC